MGALDFSGRQQLYYQRYNLLFQDIISGKYPVGCIIPAESELMNTYHVSRATARKAMEMLANDGLVSKKRGYGTFVISAQPNTSPQRVVRYTRKNRVDQVIAVKRMINQKVMKAPKDIAECLQLSDDCDIIRIKRVRYAGEEPFYLEINYFEQSFVPEVMEHDFSKESLRVFLSNAYQIQWSFAKQKIYSILADKEMAELLHIAVGSPLLYIRRISFDKDNHPRECVCTYYRADTYHLEIELAI